jgi:hypothetical protein
MKDTITNFKNIVFWQQLNKQLIDMGEKAKGYKYSWHTYLRDFCLNNSLYSRITKSLIVSEIPMVLVSNFSDIAFISAHVESWLRCLKQSAKHHNLFILYIDKAMADTFDALEKYDTKYRLWTKRSNDDNDEYYSVIHNYLKIKKQHVRDINDIINKLYELKSNATLKILKKVGNIYSLSCSSNVISIELNTKDIWNDVLKIHQNSFYIPAKIIVNLWHSSISNYSLHKDYLASRQDNNLVNDFYQHETHLLNLEYDVGKKFIATIERRMLQQASYKIPICNISPFKFLSYPFPPV